MLLKDKLNYYGINPFATVNDSRTADARKALYELMGEDIYYGMIRFIQQIEDSNCDVVITVSKKSHYT